MNRSHWDCLVLQFLRCKSRVISGDFGPNAFDALNAAGISMYLFGSCHTVQEAIQSYKLGQLEQLTSPTGTGKMHR
jgi:predicted Fe-Mo cluster-binding NifX family protein